MSPLDLMDTFINVMEDRRADAKREARELRRKNMQQFQCGIEVFYGVVIEGTVTAIVEYDAGEPYIEVTKIEMMDRNNQFKEIDVESLSDHANTLIRDEIFEYLSTHELCA